MPLIVCAGSLKACATNHRDCIAFDRVSHYKALTLTHIFDWQQPAFHFPITVAVKSGTQQALARFDVGILCLNYEFVMRTNVLLFLFGFLQITNYIFLCAYIRIYYKQPNKKKCYYIFLFYFSCTMLCFYFCRNCIYLFNFTD